MSARRANKDEIELHKIVVELPKIGITIVAFFATASALILRLSPGQTIGPEWLLKTVYFVGILVTVWMFNQSYNFLGQVIQNLREKKDDVGHDNSLEEIMEKGYDSFKNSLAITVILWVVILLGFVALA